MSGGVGPTGDGIRLPEEQEQGHEHEQTNGSMVSSEKTADSQHSNTPRKAAFLSFRQLNVLAIIVIFSASGMVCVEDLAFVLFSFIYMYFISNFAFPLLNPSSASPIFSSQNKLLRRYVSVGAVIGLYLPIAYILLGVFEGDKRGIQAAAPHVFLLCCQIFMEGVAFSDRFSIPVRVFVPVFYNSRRIFTIIDWLKDEFSRTDQANGGSARRLYVGKGLAMANMAFWCFNLFGFLLPVYLPRAFKRYYSISKVND